MKQNSTNILQFTPKDFYRPTSNFNFHIWNHPDTALHRHHGYYELFFVTKGPIDYIINEKKLLLKEKELSIVRPNDVHAFYATPAHQKTQHVNIACRADYFQMLANTISPSLLATIDNATEPIILTLTNSDFQYLNFIKRKAYLVPSDDYQQQDVAFSLLLFNILSIFALNAGKNPNLYPKWLSDLLQNVSSPDFINKSVKDLYELCPYSPPIIIKAFKTYLKQTPVEFLTEMKINYACSLLINTDYTTSSIAKRIGYESLSHFTHTFRKMKHTSPSEYRNISHEQSL